MLTDFFNGIHQNILGATEEGVAKQITNQINGAVRTGGNPAKLMSGNGIFSVYVSAESVRGNKSIEKNKKNQTVIKKKFKTNGIEFNVSMTENKVLIGKILNNRSLILK